MPRGSKVLKSSVDTGRLNLHCKVSPLPTSPEENPIRALLTRHCWCSSLLAGQGCSKPPAQITHGVSSMSNPQQHPPARENLRGAELQPQSCSHRAAAQLGTFQTAQVLLGLISASNWPCCLATVCWLLSTAPVESLEPKPVSRELKEGSVPPCITLCCSLPPLGSVPSMPCFAMVLSSIPSP